MNKAIINQELENISKCIIYGYAPGFKELNVSDIVQDFYHQIIQQK